MKKPLRKTSTPKQKRHYDKWTVSYKHDGVRPARKNLQGKREESRLIAEKTKVFLENGGKIEVIETLISRD